MWKHPRTLHQNSNVLSRTPVICFSCSWGFSVLSLLWWTLWGHADVFFSLWSPLAQLERLYILESIYNSFSRWTNGATRYNKARQAEFSLVCQKFSVYKWHRILFSYTVGSIRYILVNESWHIQKTKCDKNKDTLKYRKNHFCSST